MTRSFVASLVKSTPNQGQAVPRPDALDKMLAPRAGLMEACVQVRLLLANCRLLTGSNWAAGVRLREDRVRRNRRRLATLADVLRQDNLEGHPDVRALFKELVARWAGSAPAQFDRELDYARLEIHWVAGRRNLAVKHRIGHAARAAAAACKMSERQEKQLKAHATRHVEAACEQAGQALHTVSEEQIAQAVDFALLQLCAEQEPGRTRL